MSTCLTYENIILHLSWIRFHYGIFRIAINTYWNWHVECLWSKTNESNNRLSLSAGCPLKWERNVWNSSYFRRLNPQYMYTKVNKSKCIYAHPGHVSHFNLQIIKYETFCCIQNRNNVDSTIDLSLPLFSTASPRWVLQEEEKKNTFDVANVGMWFAVNNVLFFCVIVVIFPVNLLLLLFKSEIYFGRKNTCSMYSLKPV